jgi:HAMP domain-containing protein
MARGFRWWHALLVLALAVVAVWVWQRAQREREDPAALLAALRSSQVPALPAAEVVGASGRSEPQRYDRESLSQFIDGAADAYLARGFQQCVAGTYTFPEGDATALEVDAEVYRFATPEGARAQQEAERPAAAQQVPGMAHAVQDKGILLAIDGRDYLKLTSFGEGGGVDAALRSVAAAWRTQTR